MAAPLIRVATRADAAPLRDVVIAAYAPFRAQGLQLPPVADGLAEDIRDNLVFVAEIGGRVAGGIVMIPGDDHLKLANLAVAPWAAGRGLGRALMDRLEQTAAEGGLAELRLVTHAEMVETRRFYERLGWRERGRDGNRVHMAKTLDI